MKKTTRLALFVLAAVAASTAALASLPTPQRPAGLEVRKRFVSPSSCCEADLDMCPNLAPRRALTRTQVLTVIGREGDSARACLTEAVPTAKVRFEVDARGVANSVRIHQPISDDVATCLRRAIASWRFPTTERGLSVPISFRFERRAP